MKRSEMIAKLRDYFFGEEVRPENFCGLSNKFIEDFSDSILTFLESQGMQPPNITLEEMFTETTLRHEEKFYYSCWEPEISQETIDQALEHLGKKGVRGEMEITE